MNDDQYLIIMNMPTNSLEESIEILHKYNCTKITINNSVFKNGILISSVKVNEKLIKYLNNKIIKKSRIVCDTIKNLKNFKRLDSIENITDKEILSYQLNAKNEQILITTTHTVLYENVKPLNKIYEFPNKCVVSKTGRFIANVGEVVTLYANFKKFNEFNIKATNLEFSDDDQSIFINEIEYDIYTGERVQRNKNRLIIKDNNIYYGDIYLKNHLYIESVKEYKSENRVFIHLIKTAGTRLISIVESYYIDSEKNKDYKNVNKNATTNEIIDVENLAVTDNYFLAVCKDGVYFYELKKTFILQKELKIGTRKMAAINKYHVSAILNGENIEIYNKIELINTIIHPNCSNLKWSHSNLFLCSYGSNGLIQIINIDGNLVWKHVFMNLSGIEWRPFVEGIGDKEKIKNELSNEVFEEVVDKISDKKLLWLEFLKNQKKILTAYYKSKMK